MCKKKSPLYFVLGLIHMNRGLANLTLGWIFFWRKPCEKSRCEEAMKIGDVVNGSNDGEFVGKTVVK